MFEESCFIFYIRCYNLKLTSVQFPFWYLSKQKYSHWEAFPVTGLRCDTSPPDTDESPSRYILFTSTDNHH